MEQHNMVFFYLGLKIVCEQALVLIVGYVKCQLSYKLKKACSPFNKNKQSWSGHHRKAFEQNALLVQQIYKPGCFCYQRAKQKLEVSPLNLPKSPLLIFCLFAFLPYHIFFITEIENKSLTTLVGLERPLIISNWLCACTSIN